MRQRTTRKRKMRRRRRMKRRYNKKSRIDGIESYLEVNLLRNAPQKEEK